MDNEEDLLRWYRSEEIRNYEDIMGFSKVVSGINVLNAESDVHNMPHKNKTVVYRTNIR